MAIITKIYQNTQAQDMLLANCKSLLLPWLIVASSPPFTLFFSLWLWLLFVYDNKQILWLLIKFLVEASHHRRRGPRSKSFQIETFIYFYVVVAQCLSPPFQVIVMYTKTPRPLDSLHIGSKQHSCGPLHPSCAKATTSPAISSTHLADVRLMAIQQWNRRPRLRRRE